MRKSSSPSKYRLRWNAARSDPLDTVGDFLSAYYLPVGKDRSGTFPCDIMLTSLIHG